METKKKIIVYDTSVLIEDPEVIYKTGDAVNIIPMVVIRELDGLKRSTDIAKAKAARHFSANLERLSSFNDLSVGAPLVSGGILRVYKDYDNIDDLDSDADSKIVGAAIRLNREIGNVINVLLVSTDTNMRIVARLHGVLTGIYPGYVDNPRDNNSSQHNIERVQADGSDKRGIEFRDLADEAIYEEMKLLGMHDEIAYYFENKGSASRRKELSVTPPEEDTGQYRDLAEERLQAELKMINIGRRDSEVSNEGFFWASICDLIKKAIHSNKKGPYHWTDWIDNDPLLGNRNVGNPANVFYPRRWFRDAPSILDDIYQEDKY